MAYNKGLRVEITKKYKKTNMSKKMYLFIF